MRMCTFIACACASAYELFVYFYGSHLLDVPEFAQVLPEAVLCGGLHDATDEQGARRARLHLWRAGS
jgi:hypothetical protein